MVLRTRTRAYTRVGAVVAGEHGSVNTMDGESELTPWLLTFPEVESELNDCRSSFYDS